MGHGHYRHSRISRLHSTRHHLEAELDNEDIAPNLLEDADLLQNSIVPASDILPDESCDSSENPMCFEHGMNESAPLLQKREETTSPESTISEPNIVETELQTVDASSHVLLQPTSSNFPMTMANSVYASYTLPGSDSLTATAIISSNSPILTSPTLASAIQPAASILSQTPILSQKSLLPETSLLGSSASSTQLSIISASQAPSASRASSAAAVSSPAWTSTPLVAPSSSTAAASITSSQTHNYWSYSGPSSSLSTSSTSSITDTTTSSAVSTGPESTGTVTGSGSAPTTSGAQTSGQDPTSNPDTPKIVGGVVGSVAGLALIFFVLFYYLRRRGILMGKTGTPAILNDAVSGSGAGGREMTDRRASNDPLFGASYLAPAFMKRWRQSTATTRSGDTIDSAPSERGFQKISGRKIPPVFTHGGDGYGGGLDDGSSSISGFSPISPAAGPVGSTSTYAPPPSTPYGMPLDSNYTREVEEHTTPTQSNVHLPISSSVNVATPITVTPAHPVAQPQSAIPVAPPRPDGLGRSLHSFDGSRSSRFTEGIDL